MAFTCNIFETGKAQIIIFKIETVQCSFLQGAFIFNVINSVSWKQYKVFTNFS